MLNDENRVTQITQSQERLDELSVIALMQPDAGLVQHIQHAHELRANLRGQADTLALASRESGGSSCERQIVQAHILQKSQPREQLL